MATWADIQNWDHAYVIEAENLIEDELREARDIVADLEFASKDIRSVGKAPDKMRNRLSKIQKGLDSRINELTEYALATAELHGYVSRVVAMRKSVWEVAAEINATISESGEANLEGVSAEEEDPSRGNKYLEMRDLISDAIAIATEAEDTGGPRREVRYVRGTTLGLCGPGRRRRPLVDPRGSVCLVGLALRV